MPEVIKGFGILTHLQKEFIQILASLPDKDQFYLAGSHSCMKKELRVLRKGSENCFYIMPLDVVARQFSDAASANEQGQAHPHRQRLLCLSLSERF
jgi:hypothetical protein